MILYRDETAAKGPGLHALLIGISDYPYLPGGAKEHEGRDYDLGMKQLASPALSAFKIACWLLQAGIRRLPKPLASLRILLAPSESERQRIGQMLTQSHRAREALTGCTHSAAEQCSLEKVSTALEEWRADCATDSESVAWFYFAGHGLQVLPREPVMLLSGYNRRGGPVLGEAIAFDDVFSGMEVTGEFRKMALQQHFVVDACRSEFNALRDLVNASPSQPWSYRRASGHKTRTYGTIFGTAGGKQSFGSADGTVLAQALLRALHGEAADASLNNASKRAWIVKHYRLLEALELLVGQIAEQMEEAQTIEPGPMKDNVVWSSTPDTPILPVSIELIPADAHPPESMFLQSEGPEGKSTPVDVSKYPYAVTLEAGLYSAEVTFPPHHAYRSCIPGYQLLARPPWSPWHIPLVEANEPTLRSEGAPPS